MMRDIIIIRLLGLFFFIEGILSLCWAFEPRLLWQLSRFARIIGGLYLFIK